MEWLNLHTRVLRSPEVIGSEPIDRATWLMLLTYCAQQENGGEIADCAQWVDRKWQQLVGVTREEITRETELWAWTADGTLIVSHYPKAKEIEVANKRDSGSKGGAAKTQAKTQAAKANGAKGGRPVTQAEGENNPSRNPSKLDEETQAETQAENQQEPKHNPSENPTERKGREGKSKGMEGEGNVREAKPSLCPPQGIYDLDHPTDSLHLASMNELVAWINTLRPAWRASPHLTASEMHDLSSNAEGLRSLDTTTRQTLAEWAAHKASAEDWTLKTRSRFIGNYTEAVMKAIEWHQQLHEKSSHLNLGGRTAASHTTV